MSYWPYPRISARPATGVEREVEQLIRAVNDLGPVSRRRLYDAVGARYWGPGRFRRALRAALVTGRLRSAGGGRYAPAANPQAGPTGGVAPR